MPYGRAWFLRLTIELHLFVNNLPLRAMADYVASSLLNHFTSSSSIASLNEEYQNASWALIQLHDYFNYVNNVDGVQQIKSLVEQHLLHFNKLKNTLQDDEVSGQFFSPCGNWLYLISATQDAQVLHSILQEHSLLLPPKPIVELKNEVHHCGMNWSRTWSLKSVGKRLLDCCEDVGMCFLEAAEEHVHVGWEKHKEIQTKLSGDTKKRYYSYDHWVPQFIVYATTFHQ
jgi:hypothetical protein